MALEITCFRDIGGWDLTIRLLTLRREVRDEERGRERRREVEEERGRERKREEERGGERRREEERGGDGLTCKTRDAHLLTSFFYSQFLWHEQSLPLLGCHQ
jgi:hypothetical protein